MRSKAKVTRFATVVDAEAASSTVRRLWISTIIRIELIEQRRMKILYCSQMITNVDITSWLKMKTIVRPIVGVAQLSSVPKNIVRVQDLNVSSASSI